MASPLTTCSAPAMNSTLSTTLFYTAAFIAAATVPGHTKFGYDNVFPHTKKVSEKARVSAKIAWMEANQAFVFMSLACIKWANYGLTDTFDKVFLGLYTGAQLWTASAYFKAGIYEPLLPLLGIPALVGAALVL